MGEGACTRKDPSDLFIIVDYQLGISNPSPRSRPSSTISIGVVFRHCLPLQNHLNLLKKNRSMCGKRQGCKIDDTTPCVEMTGENRSP